MLIILFLFLVKYILLNFSSFSFISDDSLKDSVYVLFREVVIVAFGAIIIEALIYYGILSLNESQSNGAIYCLLMAMILWIYIGFVMIRCA
jgi:hypothetical protein